jgi:hypothetical protein
MGFLFGMGTAGQAVGLRLSYCAWQCARHHRQAEVGHHRTCVPSFKYFTTGAKTNS